MESKQSLFDLFTENKSRNRSSISRRSFLKTCGVSMLLAGLPVNLMKVFAEEKAQITAGATPDHVMLTWDMDPKTTQTIAWRTEKGLTDGKIQWVKKNSFKQSAWEHATTLAATNDQLDTQLGVVHLQYATLTGLQPGTNYTYRVYGDGHWSDSFNFSTQQQTNKPFKFLVFGDSQSGIATNPEYGPFRTTINNAYAAHSDAAFFMMVGDLVEVGQSYEHWNNWYAAVKDVAEKIPNMAVTGNHETYEGLE